MKKTSYFIYSLLCIMIGLGVFILFQLGSVFAQGYDMYKAATNEMSIEDKIIQIQSDEKYVPIMNISEDFIDAIVSVEDHRFYKHGGIDFIATSRAALTNMKKNRIVAGGSTITQQLAKNMYFSFDKKYNRKIAELMVAFQLEDKLNKNEILEMYCNIIYFGNGYYGIKEAANGYFGVEPNELTQEQAVLLAGIPKSPNYYNPNNIDEKTIKRAKSVVQSMVKYGHFTRNQASVVLVSISQKLAWE